MSQTLVLEGTGAELIPHLEAHSEERFRLTALSESDALENKPLCKKNWKMLEALEKIEKLNKEHPPTEGSNTTIEREPNWKALDVLRTIEERQRDQTHTDGSNTLKYLHEARDGGMYDYDPNK